MKPETNHPPEFHGGSFPLMIDLAGKTVLVVAGGAVAARKIRTLVSFGARVRVVSPALSPDVPREQVEHTAREWREEDLDGALLAVAATDRREVNAAVARACRERKILCNVADRPAECGFFFPAVAQAGAVTVGITSGGESPSLVRRVRRALQLILPEIVERAVKADE